MRSTRGGTAVKVVLLDADGRAVAQRHADVTTVHHPDGRVERDPEAFWEATARAIQAEKNKPKEYNPLKKEEKKTADGTAKVTTKYIIDNVVHTSIKVDHNYKGEKKKN